MPTFRTARVTSMISERRGLQRLSLAMPDGSEARAYALTQLTGTCETGDEVVVNTTAVELGLGTGGWHFVHWNLARSEFVSPGPDHVMKIRYTSLQVDAGTDELGHPECDEPLGGVPVVVCSVHSQIAAVAAAFAARAPGKRLVYVMTDGAALPLAISDLVVELVDRGLLAATVTAGHAFGGDREAVTVPSGIGLAVHTEHADAVVVSMGPGVVGTGTSLGTTAMEVAAILDAVEASGGVPIMCVRASDGDERQRHVGISHHSLTAARLSRCEPLAATVPPEVFGIAGVRPLRWPVPDASAILGDVSIRVTTMGRDPSQDPLFFAAACAAGEVAAAVSIEGIDAVVGAYLEPRSGEPKVVASKGAPEEKA